MKIIILSDIHGSSEYMDIMNDIFVRENPDKIVILGDILYHGFSTDNDVDRVVDILNNWSSKIVAVRGNCDNEYDERLLRFDISKLYKVLEVDGLKLYLTHGDHLNMVPYYDGILVHGHTHVYHLGTDYINPGSISKPRTFKEHTFIIYEHKTFNLFDIDGNLLDKIQF